MRVRPEYFLDTQTWEIGEYIAKSLRELLTKLPKGSRIVGYYPSGAPLIKHVRETKVCRFDRPVMQHIKPPRKKKQEIVARRVVPRVVIKDKT